MKRCRRSFPTPNAAAITSGERLSGFAIRRIIAAKASNGNERSERKGNVRRRSLILYLTLAALAALIASRVNRFPPPQLKPPPHATVLDEIIPDVTVDLHTLDKAINSIAAKARTHLSIDPGIFPHNQRTTLITQGFLHVRNVRLGVLLATVL